MNSAPVDVMLYSAIAAMLLVGVALSFALTPRAYTCVGYCNESGRFNFIHEHD